MTTGGAQTRAGVARKITESLPACQAMMAAGFMGYRQAQLVAEAVNDAGLGERGIAAVDARVASRIKGQSWPAFRRTLRRAVLAANPDVVLAEHMAALKHRWVEKVDFHDTVMSQLQIKMSAIDAQTVWLGLDATAMQLQADAKSAGLMDEGIDAYRSDALVVWANNALADPKAPRRQGRRHQVQFVTDLPSLLGLADNPAELPGFGPIPAALVRDRATEADWRRLIVDPVTGHLLDYGSVTYRPPAELKDYLIARDRRCRFPGCNTRATVCDIDHNIPAPRGDTSAKNCCCLCHRHHQLKTFGGWTVQLKPDGSCLWTSPGGRRIRVRPTTPTRLKSRSATVLDTNGARYNRATATTLCASSDSYARNARSSAAVPSRCSAIASRAALGSPASTACTIVACCWFEWTILRGSSGIASSRSFTRTRASATAEANDGEPDSSAIARCNRESAGR